MCLCLRKKKKKSNQNPVILRSIQEDIVKQPNIEITDQQSLQNFQSSRNFHHSLSNLSTNLKTMSTKTQFSTIKSRQLQNYQSKEQLSDKILEESDNEQNVDEFLSENPLRKVKVYSNNNYHSLKSVHKNNDIEQFLEQANFNREIFNKHYQKIHLWNDRKIEHFYQIGEKLGEGKFGNIFKIKSKKTQENYALKSISKYQLEDAQNSFQRVLGLLFSLPQHPNIVQTYSLYITTTEYQMIMEYCNMGSLEDYFKDKKNVKESELNEIISQIIKGLCFLHDNNIIHRDIKPANILLHKDEETNKIVVKISDFDLADYCEPGQILDHQVGTMNYMSYQVQCGKYSNKCDIWSLGALVYKLIFQENLYNSLTQTLNTLSFSQTLNKNEKQELYSSELFDLLEKMLQIDESTRPTINECLNHPWIQQHQNQEH